MPVGVIGKDLDDQISSYKLGLQVCSFTFLSPVRFKPDYITNFKQWRFFTVVRSGCDLLGFLQPLTKKYSVVMCGLCVRHCMSYQLG